MVRETITGLLASGRYGGGVRVAGQVSSVHRQVSKATGKPWAIVMLTDGSASIEVLFFPAAYSIYRNALAVNAVVSVEGKLILRDGVVSIFAQIPLTQLRDAVLEAAECVHDPHLHTGPDVFEHEPKDEREAREAVAKDVCEGCTVRDLCEEYAVRILPAAGIWAGKTAAEIAAVAAARTRAAAAAAPLERKEAA